MFCVNCGKPYSAADRFCNSCGHQIPSATIQENSIAQSVITLQSLASTVPQASAARCRTRAGARDRAASDCFAGRPVVRNLCIAGANPQRA